jgi:hypothetical protein
MRFQTNARPASLEMTGFLLSFTLGVDRSILRFDFVEEESEGTDLL